MCWTFHKGDVRRGPDLDPAAAGQLFIDAAHTRSFARWYAADLLPRLRPGTVVSVHDVYRRRRPGRFSEGRVVLDWLAVRGLPHFTASAVAAPGQHAALLATKRALGLADPVHQDRPNPMLYFRTAR